MLSALFMLPMGLMPLVKHHVSRNLLALDYEKTLKDAARLMRGARITGAPVVEDRELSGVLSRNDLLRSIAALPSVESDEAYESSLEHLREQEVWRPILNKEPVTVHPDSSMLEAAELMTQRKLNRLIVKGTVGSVLGLVSSTDVVFACLDCAADDAVEVDISKHSYEFSIDNSAVLESSIQSHMTSSLIVMSPDMSLTDAARLLRAARVTGAPVLEGKELVGVLSRYDLLRAIVSRVPEGASEDEAAAALEELKAAQVRDVMKSNPITISPDASMVTAAKLMAEERLNRVLVTTEPGGPLCGILSSTDVVFVMLGCDSEDCGDEEMFQDTETMQNMFGDHGLY